FHCALGAVAAAIPLLLMLAPTARTDAPHVFAIKDARIVTGTGSVISKGTVVFRDGIITEVGETAAIPGDARQIDGSGLTVYPGLIDAFTTLGLPATALAPQRPAPGGFNPEAIRIAATATPERAEEVHGEPWLAAANEVKPEGAPIQEARMAGITTVLSSPTRGILAGESAVVDLAGDSGANMVVRAPVALTVQFTTSRGFFNIYPNSLMGSISFIRQSFYDAIHYRDELDRYARVKTGIPRPEYDHKSEALLPALKGDLPVLFVAASDLDIRRALMIAAEFKLKPMIEGATTGYRIADRLASEKVPVILSVDYPKRPATLPEDADESLETLIARAEAPTCAGRLAKAGIAFAFSSGSLKPADFIANVRKAVDNGLTADDALKALTVNAAGILGVADHLGTIEKGKVANLTVTKGDLFAKDSKVDKVFIDGNEMDLTPPEAPAGPGAGPGGPGGPGFGAGRPGGPGRPPAAERPDTEAHNLPPLDLKALDQA
ncbi:MAG: amidohydrolase family protein, partial [Blastocatellia bacterium]